MPRARTGGQAGQTRRQTGSPAKRPAKSDAQPRAKSAARPAAKSTARYSVPIEAMIPHGMRLYAALCGGTLARAHARSGDRIAIASYLGGSDVFDRAITDFAAAYADQNERDFEALTEAAASGQITAERGV